MVVTGLLELVEERDADEVVGTIEDVVGARLFESMARRRGSVNLIKLKATIKDHLYKIK